MNQSGEWVEDEDQVMDIILSGYKELYQTQHLTSISTADFEIEWVVALSEEDSRKLSVMPLNTEILKALSSLKPCKAPGVDGLHARFFQHFWHILESSVIDKILTIFATKRIPSYLNHTLVTLILKRNGPEVLGHFRPISLCTTIYKMVSKIIINRIRPHVQHLVSPLQAAFIPGRKGLDNMIIAQEILHFMEKKKGRVGTMALKIDLEKAFDRLEWSFLREVLVHFNFPSNLIAIIMDCISSTFVSVLFNGGKLPTFSPSCGIRQGDLISPYIFIMCLEYLGLLTHDKTANNSWKPIKASRSGPAFSHLFFADDLMLFGQASLKNSETIDEVLTTFC